MTGQQRYAVLGLGIENLALTKYLLAKGEKVTVCDSRTATELGPRYHELAAFGVVFRLGSDYLEGLTDFDTLFRSPGLPLFEPKLQEAAGAGVRITSAMRLFVSLCPCPIIGVTGTKGKGTTSSLIYQILKRHREKTGGQVFLGGNIGIAPFDFLPALTSGDTVVLELSSFQLEDMDRSASVAVITNITEDHLSAADPLNPNYHKSRAEYVRAKTNLYRHQDQNGVTILNMEDPTSREMVPTVPGQLLTYGSSPREQGAWYQPRPEGGYRIFWNVTGSTEQLIDSESIQVRGEHNLLNISAAALACYTVGASQEAIVEGISAYTGLEHRLEYLGVAQGVSFYDDSFATAPDPTIIALRAFEEPIVLIAGGADKGADFTVFAEEIVARNVKAVVLIGVTGPKIREAIERASRRLGKHQPELAEGGAGMPEIVARAMEKAEPGDVILLSTACASFGLFRNYKERGDLFKSEFKKLKAEFTCQGGESRQ